MKICSKCKTEKELDEFGKDKTSNTGYDSKCKLCKKEYYLKNKEHASKRQKIYYKNNKEERVKYSKEFYKNNKNYFQKYNVEKKEQQQIYYQERNINNKEYYQQYKEENKERIKKYSKERYKTDIKYKLTIILRSHLYRLVTKTNKNKSNSAKNLLGCNLDEFKQHLEKQFKPEMTWNNYGKVWEIDHIIPCFSFNLEDKEQQKQCFHYTNMRPLFKTTEKAKSFGYLNEIGNQNRSKTK